MKKNYFFGIAAALMMGTAALSSCSNDELTVGNEAQIAKNGAKTYSFSVQAVMDNEAGTRVFDEIGESTISSAFSTEEPIYVFIKKEDGNIAYGDKTLHPDQDGPTCTLKVEELNFIPKNTDFEVEVGDKVYLYYGMSVNSNYPTDGYYKFTTDGKKTTTESMDYNLAVMKITSIDNDVLTFGQIEDETKTNFSFKNINSVFRQKITFKNGSSTVTPTISSIVISTTDNKTVQYYYPFKAQTYNYGPIETSLDSDENIYFSLIFNEDNKNEAITFTAHDNSGNTYTLTKSAPQGGFKNNIYYYGDATLEWESGLVNGANLVAENGVFSLGGLEDLQTPITLSGNGDGYAFNVDGYEGTLTLDNVTATNTAVPFLSDPNYSTNLNLVLTGSNTINCPNSMFCIEGGEITLSCTGTSATLTLTTNSDLPDACGIAATGSVSAANGFTVDCSAHLTQANTWIYTVTKNP